MVDKEKARSGALPDLAFSLMGDILILFVKAWLISQPFSEWVRLRQDSK